MKSFLQCSVCFFVGLCSVSTGFANNVLSVPPGYAFFRGIAFNPVVYDAALRKGKEEGYNAIVITNLSSLSDGKVLFSIRERYEIRKVEPEISFSDNDMVVCACKEINIGEVKLFEGEYAIWRNGKLQKSAERLPIEKVGSGKDKDINAEQRSSEDPQERLREILKTLPKK